jgi:FixJ family two-component response regulator
MTFVQSRKLYLSHSLVVTLTPAKNAISVVPQGDPVVSDCKVPKKRPLIAIIDDDEQVRDAIKGLMRAAGFAAETFPSATEFLRSSLLKRVSCVIADVNMPEMSGVELYFELLQRGNTIPTILITAFPTESDHLRVLDAGVINYLAKPFADSDLLDGVRTALARRLPNGDHNG